MCLFRTHWRIFQMGSAVFPPLHIWKSRIKPHYTRMIRTYMMIQIGHNIFDQVSAALLDSELTFKKAEQILTQHIPPLRPEFHRCDSSEGRISSTPDENSKIS